MNSNKASVPQLCPFHFGTHLLGNNFYLQPCLMRCSVSTARNWVGHVYTHTDTHRLNGQYHCKVLMIYSAALRGRLLLQLERLHFQHAPSNKHARVMDQPLNSTPQIHSPLKTGIQKCLRRQGLWIPMSAFINSIGLSILPQWNNRTIS